MKGFKVGDVVGVGCFVDSCLTCKQCLAGNEHKCTSKSIATYQGENKHGRAAVYPPDSVTLGKDSDDIIAAKARYTIALSMRRWIHIQDGGALPIRYPHPTVLSH